MDILECFPYSDMESESFGKSPFFEERFSVAWIVKFKSEVKSDWEKACVVSNTKSSG